MNMTRRRFARTCIVFIVFVFFGFGCGDDATPDSAVLEDCGPSSHAEDCGECPSGSFCADPGWDVGVDADAKSSRDATEDAAPDSSQDTAPDITEDAASDAADISEDADADLPDPTPCDDGTWDHDANPTSACVSWTECVANEFVAHPGSATTDRICEACPVATFSRAPNASACTPDYFTRISHGNGHSCGFRASDDKLMCWGNNCFGQASEIPAGVTFDSVVAGFGLTCARRSDDATVSCWGKHLLNPR